MLTNKQLLLVWIEFIGKIKKQNSPISQFERKLVDRAWLVAVNNCCNLLAMIRSATKCDVDKARFRRTVMSTNRDGSVVNFTRKEESRWQRYRCRAVRRSAMAVLSMCAESLRERATTSWICVKWDCSNCISRDGFCRDTRKHDYFLASSLDFPKELRIYYGVFNGNRVYKDKHEDVTSIWTILTFYNRDINIYIDFLMI